MIVGARDVIDKVIPYPVNSLHNTIDSSMLHLPTQMVSDFINATWGEMLVSIFICGVRPK